MNQINFHEPRPNIGDTVVIIGDSLGHFLKIGNECTIGFFDIDAKQWRIHSKHGVQWAPADDIKVVTKKVVAAWLPKIAPEPLPLPKISFCLPTVDQGAPNMPHCECSDCGKVLYETNIYWCPKPNCLVQVKLEKETISERLVTKSDLHKLAQKEKR